VGFTGSRVQWKVARIQNRVTVEVRGGSAMEDILWIAVTIAFFALSIGYVHFCDRVK
jgi:hypothetical protein